MIVVGGCYREVCERPKWNQIFGSGGRAAIALSSWTKVKLFTYACSKWTDDARLSFESFGIDSDIKEIEDDIVFSYFHSLSPSLLQPSLVSRCPPIKVVGEGILRFSFIEGDAIVDGKTVVYDPQGTTERYHQNGSTAEELCLVLNELEAYRMSEASNVSDAGHRLLASHSSIKAVVIKRGALGCVVFEPDQSAAVPCYRSERVFKIGSGDVFSAAFAHEWIVRRDSAANAANTASKAVSEYVESQSLPLPDPTELADRAALQIGASVGPIYIAGPFFTTSQLWLIEELVRSLRSLDAAVFSPYHDVGMNLPADKIAREDLAGLEKCTAVLAVLDGNDPGTIFEIGYARKAGIPVVILAESSKNSDLTMLTGSDCLTTDDLSTAVYHAVWSATR